MVELPHLDFFTTSSLSSVVSTEKSSELDVAIKSIVGGSRVKKDQLLFDIPNLHIIHKHILKQGLGFLLPFYSSHILFYYYISCILYLSSSSCFNTSLLVNDEATWRRVVYHMRYVDNLMVVYGGSV